MIIQLLRCIILLLLICPSHTQAQWLDVSDSSNQFYWQFSGFENFETGQNFYISPDSTTWSDFGSWQVGSSFKSFFGTSYSPELGIMTDTLQPYPTNANDYFNVFPSSNCNGIVLEFTHKFETDSLIDGGIVEVMIDSMNWVNIIDLGFTVPQWGVWNFYDHQDSLTGGQFGFSGTQNQWTTSRIGIITHHPIKTNWYHFVAIRFRFISDSIQTQKDGWIIDNFKVWDICLPGSVREATLADFSIEYANGNCHLVFEEMLISPGSLQIFDLNGKAISEQWLEEGNHRFTIATEGLSNGVYSLYFTNEEFVLREKIIVASP